MNNALHITVLIENSASRRGLKAEHGWACLIEVNGRRVLFDTGQTDLLLDNARALGCALDDLDAIVLSHGHYDHTGGLAYALPLAKKAKVIMHPKAAIPRFSIRPGSAPKPIGITEKALASLTLFPREQIIDGSTPQEFIQGAGTTGQIPKLVDFEGSSGPFFLDLRGEKEDGFEDEQALWISTPTGLIVCAGCCHAGLINTLKQAKSVSGATGIRAVIGGFHLGQASDERIEKTIAALKEIAPELIAPCHCTGERAALKIQAAFGAQFSPAGAGRRFLF